MTEKMTTNERACLLGTKHQLSGEAVEEIIDVLGDSFSEGMETAASDVESWCRTSGITEQLAVFAQNIADSIRDRDERYRRYMLEFRKVKP